MISIIVSSINKAQSLAFRQNIEETIGVECELLIHNNLETNWGLCQLYNYYAPQCRYNIICFFHQDILFHTQNWGKEVIYFLSNHPEAGVLGFAGSILKTQYLSGWGSHSEATRQHLFQHFPNGEIRKLYTNPNKENFSAVALVDGLALITTKKVWSEHPFDEQLFKRFHLYDLDFTMQVAQHYTNYICHTIDIEHFSCGSYTKEWFIESNKFISKWKDKLPFYIQPSSNNFIQKCQNFDVYKAARMQLIYAPEELGSLSMLKKFYQVKTFPYKWKLIRHICSAAIARLKFQLNAISLMMASETQRLPFGIGKYVYGK